MKKRFKLKRRIRTENVSRKDVGFKRNEWAKNKILSIRVW